MTPVEILIDALTFYEIPIKEKNGPIVSVINDYEIEVEANGLYKLKQQQHVIAPFDDLDELCTFILRG